MVRIRIPLWSRLTRVQRVLLAAIAVVVVGFIASVGIGAGRGDGDPTRPPGFVTWLGGLFGEPVAVDPADLTGACLPVDGLSADRVLVVSGTCVLQVAPAEADLRNLKLRAQGEVTVEAPMPRGEGTAARDLADGEELTVSVNAEGADITLTCAGSSACAVELR